MGILLASNNFFQCKKTYFLKNYQKDPSYFTHRKYATIIIISFEGSVTMAIINLCDGVRLIYVGVTVGLPNFYAVDMYLINILYIIYDIKVPDVRRLQTRSIGRHCTLLIERLS